MYSTMPKNFKFFSITALHFLLQFVVIINSAPNHDKAGKSIGVPCNFINSDTTSFQIRYNFTIDETLSTTIEPSQNKIYCMAEHTCGQIVQTDRCPSFMINHYALEYEESLSATHASRDTDDVTQSRSFTYQKITFHNNSLVEFQMRYKVFVSKLEDQKFTWDPKEEGDTANQDISDFSPTSPYAKDKMKKESWTWMDEEFTNSDNKGFNTTSSNLCVKVNDAFVCDQDSPEFRELLAEKERIFKESTEATRGVFGLRNLKGISSFGTPKKYLIIVEEEMTGTNGPDRKSLEETVIGFDKQWSLGCKCARGIPQVETYTPEALGRKCFKLNGALNDINFNPSFTDLSTCPTEKWEKVFLNE